MPSGNDVFRLSDRVVAARRALEAISLDCFVVSRSLLSGVELVDDDVAELRRCPIFEQWTWLDSYIENNRHYLGQDAFDRLVDTLQQEMRSSLDYCCNRAENFGRLAALSAFHGDHDRSKGFLRDASKDLIGYGWRKDFLLHDVLNLIEKCAEANCGDPWLWVRRIAPAIAGINDFTDGDETDHFPVKLGTVLSKVLTDGASTYYLWLMSKEDYRYARDAFESVLRQIDLSSPIDRAIALTAIDDASLHYLDDRAREGNTSAADILADISRSFGDVTMPSIDVGGTVQPDDTSELEPAPLPKPNLYPPEELPKYLSAVRELQGHFRDGGLDQWLRFWCSNGREEDALAALVQADEQGQQLCDYWRVYELMRELRGRAAAYPWLIKGAASEHIWDKRWAQDDKAQQYWQIVNEDFTSDCLDFFIKSFRASHDGVRRDLWMQWRTPRIVDYLIYMGKTREAVEIASAVVNFSVESVQTLPLPIPEWVEE